LDPQPRPNSRAAAFFLHKGSPDYCGAVDSIFPGKYAFATLSSFGDPRQVTPAAEGNQQPSGLLLRPYIFSLTHFQRILCSNLFLWYNKIDDFYNAVFITISLSIISMEEGYGTSG